MFNSTILNIWEEKWKGELMIKLWGGKERENEPWETIMPVFLARGKWDTWSNTCHDCAGDHI